jgi:hypothetical protein
MPFGPGLAPPQVPSAPAILICGLHILFSLLTGPMFLIPAGRECGRGAP